MSDQQPPYGPPPGQSPGQSPYGPPPGQAGPPPSAPPPGPYPGRPPQPPTQPPTQPLSQPGPFGPPPTQAGGQQPPGQPPYGGTPEYAAFGGGPQKPRNNRKMLIGVGAVVAAAAIVGGGAFAAASLLGGDDDGPAAAEALPSTTFAFASVDLSKAGGAISMLKKFPSLADDADAKDLSDGDDVEQKLVDQILGEAGDLCGGLSWDKDFAPWLGHTAAVAGVDVDGSPVPVGVVQSTDDAKAKAELSKLSDCSQGHVAGQVTDGWVVVGTDADTITKVVKATDSGSLADDSTYQDKMDAVGDQGALTFYAGPKAGEQLSKALDSYGQMLDGLTGSLSGSDPFSSDDPFGSDDPYSDDSGGLLGQACPGLGSGGASGMIDSYKKALESFGGGAATLRFADGGVELESAVDFGKASGASDEAGSLVGSLPSDTAAALGVSVGDGWFDQVLDNISAVCGGADASQLEDSLSQLTGLTFPDDIDTLLGDGLALAIGDDVDFDAPSPAGQPIGLKIKGDADGIDQVLAKIRASIQRAGSSDDGMLDSDKSDDTVAIGPDGDYRKSLLGDGGLSGESAFKDVVPHADKASMILYVDFDSFDHLVEQDGSGDDVADFKALKALGISGWYDGTTAHSFIRLSTD